MMIIILSCDLFNVIFICEYYIVLRYMNKDNEIWYFKRVKKKCLINIIWI